MRHKKSSRELPCYTSSKPLYTRLVATPDQHPYFLTLSTPLLLNPDYTSCHTFFYCDVSNHRLEVLTYSTGFFTRSKNIFRRWILNLLNSPSNINIVPRWLIGGCEKAAFVRHGTRVMPINI